MTIAALLRHHGVEVPRFVTVDGQIVFDDVYANTDGYAHATLGAVSPVSPHTFHGGSTAEGVSRCVARAWWDDPVQLERNVSSVEKCFPVFVYSPADHNNPPSWSGVVDSGRGRFKIVITGRRDNKVPRVQVRGPKLGVNAGRRWVPAPHLYLNGDLCVASAPDWKSNEHTVATVIGWSAHWLAAYTEWRMSRRWPTPGVNVAAA